MNEATSVPFSPPTMERQDGHHAVHPSSPRMGSCWTARSRDITRSAMMAPVDMASRRRPWTCKLAAPLASPRSIPSHQHPSHRLDRAAGCWPPTHPRLPRLTNSSAVASASLTCPPADMDTPCPRPAVAEHSHPCLFLLFLLFLARRRRRHAPGPAMARPAELRPPSHALAVPSPTACRRHACGVHVGP